MMEYTNIIECFLPNGSQYPLCVGKGLKVCKECDLYEDREDDGGHGKD